MTEDEMVGWHHRLDAHEFEHTPGVGDGRESLVCYTRGSQRVGHDWPGPTPLQVLGQVLSLLLVPVLPSGFPAMLTL